MRERRCPTSRYGRIGRQIIPQDLPQATDDEDDDLPTSWAGIDEKEEEEAGAPFWIRDDDDDDDDP